MVQTFKCDLNRGKAMKRHGQILFTLVTLFVLLFLVIGMFAYITYSFGINDRVFMPSQKKMEKIFTSNQNELESIAKYLFSLEYNAIRLDYDSINKMESFKNNMKSIININDSLYIENLQSLWEHHFTTILKESNYVRFERWISFSSSCGIIYCPNNNPMLLDTFGEMEISKMNSKGWYYYKYTEE